MVGGIDMKTIEERAREYASKKGDISLIPIYNEALAKIYKEGYMAGALEQKVIDINKACEWLKENVEGGIHPQSAYGFVEKFRKAIEE